jgi:hypothetical protein
VTSRNRRDRELAALGWQVLHFSGSELQPNPMVVAAEVLEAAADAMDAAKAVRPSATGRVAAFQAERGAQRGVLRRRSVAAGLASQTGCKTNGPAIARRALSR